MKLFVAPTDFAWYSFLAARKPDEVNFWQPSAGVGFHALDILAGGNGIHERKRGSVPAIGESKG
jgi:hypothetical protein